MSLLLAIALAQEVDLDRLARVGGAKRTPEGLEFTGPGQAAEGPSPRLDGIEAMTVAVWVKPLRRGEQLFVRRGAPETAPSGDRLFRPQPDWVSFVLGTDERGFFMGTIHGNGRMPFIFVTLNEVPTHAWSRLVLVKDAEGFQHFYMNGALVCTDREAAAAGVVRPFRDTAGEPVRLSVPLGGWIRGSSIFPRALSAEEIRRDAAGTDPPAPVRLRDIDLKPRPDLWPEPMAAETWPRHRERILQGMRGIFGDMPSEKVPLGAKVLSEEDLGPYIRRKVSIQVHADDRMPAWLLIPKRREGRRPAVVCFYGTTRGSGKDTTVGLTGEKNRGFAVDMVEAGFVALAPDYLRDGERVSPGRKPYDSTDFYAKFPDWSIHGKDTWDTMRAIDYLQSLDIVDPDRIGMVGHSYGGHSTIFTAAVEPRIKAAWANGPVSDFVQHGMHWATPKGGGSSQSLPAMRPYLLEGRRPPITFYEVTALIAPRALVVGQAVGERRPMEEENHAAVKAVYESLGASGRVRYVWYPGDHDFPPHVRRAAVEFFKREL